MYYTTKPSFGVWGLGFRVQGPGSTASVAEELPLEELCLASDMFERKQEFSRLFKDSERERERERERAREREREIRLAIRFDTGCYIEFTGSHVRCYGCLGFWVLGFRV